MTTNNPDSHVSGRMRRLATPWAIALDRAQRVSGLPPGPIIDIACGSSLQLAAYCSVLGRAGVGIDIDADCIEASALTMRNALDEDSLRESRLICGDCLQIDDLGLHPQLKFSLLHLDPARPQDVQRHTLDEMQPNPLIALSTWWGRLAGEAAKRMVVLDLSPRLSAEQCGELDATLAAEFIDAERTWEWTSQGRGRVDRLCVWLGGAATAGKRARYVRIPPGPDQQSIVLEARFAPWESSAPSTSVQEPELGDSISLVDPALLASGVQRDWLEETTDIHWLRLAGRRPLLLHASELPTVSGLDLLVQTGRVRGLVDADPEQSVEELIHAGSRLDLNRLTLRLSMEPTLHPRRQRELDRGLPDEGSAGYVLRLPSGMLAICS